LTASSSEILQYRIKDELFYGQIQRKGETDKKKHYILFGKLDEYSINGIYVGAYDHGNFQVKPHVPNKDNYRSSRMYGTG